MMLPTSYNRKRWIWLHIIMQKTKHLLLHFKHFPIHSFCKFSGSFTRILILQHAAISKQREQHACTFPCMSRRRVRVTPKPPSPKSCSQFIVTWEWDAGRRMNKAPSLVTQLNEGQRSFCGSPRSFSAALRKSKIMTETYSAQLKSSELKQWRSLCGASLLVWVSGILSSGYS